MNTTRERSICLAMNGATIVGLMGMAWFFWYCWCQGIFQSQVALESFLSGCGIWAPPIFTVIQGVQVVISILPGAIGCLAGVLIFGSLWGFVCSYVGISLGSLGAFLLARRYGPPLVRNISPKNYKKYIGWLEQDNKFEKFFAAAIFFPVAPDDFLCYLAGLTRMRFGKMRSSFLPASPFPLRCIVQDCIWPRYS